MNTCILQARDIYFKYPQGEFFLEGINLSVREGEFITILGANGSGKTTLLKILNGLIKPTRGEVFLEKENIKDIERDFLFRKVCTCFQNPDDQLFSPTVREDISFGPYNMGLSSEEVKRRVDKALELVGMRGSAERLIQSLSFGEKKRVCLAGVLSMGPKIMLLDEPTSGLDPKGVSTIMKLLKKINVKNSITMIMATHSVDLVPLFADRAVILSEGKIMVEGSPGEVFSDTQTIRSVKLRLPRIGHLFEILKKKDNLDIDGLPLTIGEARREIKKLVSLT